MQVRSITRRLVVHYVFIVESVSSLNSQLQVDASQFRDIYLDETCHEFPSLLSRKLPTRIFPTHPLPS
jgi:hypothetical protein